MSTPPRPTSDDALAAGLVAQPVKTSPSPLRPHRQRLSWCRYWVRMVGVTMLLAGAGTLVSVSLWASAVFIVRPHPPRWLAGHLPVWSHNRSEAPLQTQAEIEAELQPQQRYLGDVMALNQASEDAQLQDLSLWPIFETRSPCTQGCETIVELRLYGLHHREQGTNHWQLLHQLKVEGPTEEEVLDPISHGDVGTVGSTYQLPLESLKPLYEQGLPGAWLTLTGRWRTQGSPVLHGQLLYINPQTLRIHSLLNWKSPPGRLPAWHNLDGEGLPELLIHQSYGLEPHYSLYAVSNVQAVNAITRLEEIALTPLPLPSRLSTQPYQDALFLAQQELWSDAEGRLKQLKQQATDQWTMALERQLQLVSLHARFSQNQADRDWSQPSQKLLALLLDGRWQAALEAVHSAQSGYQRAVLPLLERDSSRIWQRLTAALRVNAGQKEARLWGALLLMAKEDEAAAIKWLAQNQNQPDDLKKEFEAIAQAVSPTAPQGLSPGADTNVPKPTEVAATAAPETATPASRLSGLLGIATPLESINAATWRAPTRETNWVLADGQQWYAIALQRGYGKQQWQTPFSSPPPPSTTGIATFLQGLGLNSGATLQLIDADSGKRSHTVQIRAVQWRGDIPTLLASGPAVSTPGTYIATLPNQWTAVADLPGQSLQVLFQNHPEIRDRLLPTLNHHLGFGPTQLTASLQAQTQHMPPLALGHWVNFTDTSAPEILVTFTPELMTYLGSPNTTPTPINLILTSQGELLYSSLWHGSAQTLLGWIQPPGSRSALVTLKGNQIHLLAWSAQHRQFRSQ